MKYFIYCPMEFNQSEAYDLVKNQLEEGQIVTLHSNKITKHAVGFNKLHTSLYDTYLIQISDDGTMKCIHQKGFN
jgi:hypothetical protein